MARRLFVSPPARRMVLPILAFSLMESFLLVYPSLDGWRVAWGAVGFALPAYLAAYATVPLAERLGGRMYFRRSFLLVFVGLIMVGAIELVVVVALTAYSIFGGTTYAFRIDRAVVLGYGAVLWIRAVILTATSNSRYVRTLPAAALHPVLGLVGLAVFAHLGVWDIVMAFAVYVLFFLSAVAYTEIAKRPLLRSFGADGLKLLRSTLDQYGEQEEAGIAELETFFDSISVRARCFEPWSAALARLAAHKNVCCKLSGLLTEAGERWRPEDLLPYATRVVECFGPERVLYGSDWPVLTLAGDYRDWYGFTERVTQGWSATDRSRFYGDNAARVYGL